MSEETGDLFARHEAPIKFILPEIIIGPIKYSIGKVYHLIRESRDYTALTAGKIKISPRIEEKYYELNNGEKIIITERRKIAVPDKIDGIIRSLEDGSYEWIFHKEKSKLENLIKEDGLKSLTQKTAKTWKDAFIFKSEKVEEDGNVLTGNEGLRPPQLGGLYSIGSHWSLKNKPAKIVMPTGTGKTETMLSALCAFQCSPLLVAVPTKPLRDQTAQKFITLGLLKKFSLLPEETLYPVVGIITSRPKTVEDLRIFEDCNVLVGTVSSLSSGTAENFAAEIAKLCDTLILDEAHHVGAVSWKKLKEGFKDKKVLLFTATPFREDGKLVDGDIIYDYPLKLAQEDGYFKKINFTPVHKLTKEEADQEIAEQAISILRNDLANGLNHILMARCDSIDRASNILEIYESSASDLKPTLIHSELKDSDQRLSEIKKGDRKIVICVDMLGEGFDLPQLKVCALHDPHKSLSVILQFTGRFTRSSGLNLGEASVVANIADDNFSLALERLYSENSDWNYLLSEMSSEAAKQHARLINFLNGAKVVEGENVSEEEQISISHHLLRPALSTLVYKANRFNPKNFFQGLPSGFEIARVWLNENENTLFFVTTMREIVKWTRSKEIVETDWDLFVLHFDDDQNLLYLHSTNKSSNFEKMAHAVGANDQIIGEKVFRSLGEIGRLTFQNMGVSKHGRRNLSYTMYTGADVKDALSVTETGSGAKSNLSGNGWENGKQITIGCSRKGRVWSPRKGGTIPEFIDWAKNVGRKLKDDTIDTSKIIENVLIPEEINKLPDVMPLGIEWPNEVFRYPEDRMAIKRSFDEDEFLFFDLIVGGQDNSTNRVYFNLIHDDGSIWGEFFLELCPIEKFKVFGKNPESSGLKIIIGSNERPICEFFNDYPPLIRYVDLRELDGNLLIKPYSQQELTIPDEFFETWDWVGVDITKESIWKDNIRREDSVQWHVAQKYIANDYLIVFDDDGANEAADLVCIKEHDDHIELVLIHCKFSGGTTPGTRIKDAVEVTSQAVRSTKWSGEFKKLCKHLLARDYKRSKAPGQSFLLAGVGADITKMSRASRFKEVKTSVVIVQPGISKSGISADQRAVIAAGSAYLKETLNIELDIICSV